MLLDPASFAARRRVCFFAHYDADGIVADHVLFHLEALRRAGFAVAVASTATLDEKQRDRLRAGCDGLLMRPNVGLDFGGWQELHALLPDIDPDWLLLCNDSVYGPVTDLAAYVDALVARPADLHAIVGNEEYERHAQSWFLLLGRAARRSPAFRAMMEDRIAPTMAKADIIRRFELRLAGDLQRAGLTVSLAYDPARDSLIQRHAPFNAAHLLWRELLESGTSPFIKIELLRDNPLAVDDTDRWQEVVGTRVPALVPMIEADLARRRAGRFPAGRVARQTWRRSMIRADFRLVAAGHHARARANAVAFRALSALRGIAAPSLRRLAGRPA